MEEKRYTHVNYSQGVTIDKELLNAPIPWRRHWWQFWRKPQKFYLDLVAKRVAQAAKEVEEEMIRKILGGRQ